MVIYQELGARKVAYSNITVLNGADGVGELMAGLVTQTMTVYNATRLATEQADVDRRPLRKEQETNHQA